MDGNWRTMRSDWKAFDPRASLSENQARQGADELRANEHSTNWLPWSKTAHGAQRAAPKAAEKFVKYESGMQENGRDAGCKDWGSHPLDCMRQAYGNHLKGTRLAKLRRHYDGRVTHDALARERAHIEDKVCLPHCTRPSFSSTALCRVGRRWCDVGVERTGL